MADPSTRRVSLTFDVEEDVALFLSDVLRAVKKGRPDLYDRVTRAECVVVHQATWEPPPSREKVADV